MAQGRKTAEQRKSAGETSEELKQSYELLMRDISAVDGQRRSLAEQLKQIQSAKTNSAISFFNPRLNKVLEDFYKAYWQTEQKREEFSWLPRNLHLRSFGEMFRAYHYDAIQPLESTYLEVPEEVKEAVYNKGGNKIDCRDVQRKLIRENKYDAFIAAIELRLSLLAKNSEQLKIAPACHLVAMTELPGQLDFKGLPFKEDEAYVWCASPGVLYYVNKLTGECIELIERNLHSPTEKQTAFSQLLLSATKEPQPLDDTQLDLIRTVSCHSREKSSDNIFCVLYDLVTLNTINHDQVGKILKLIRPYELDDKAVAANDEKALVNALWQAIIDQLLPLTGNEYLQLPVVCLIQALVYRNSPDMALKWPPTMFTAEQHNPGMNNLHMCEVLADGLLPLCFQLAQPPKALNTLEQQRVYKEKIIRQLHCEIDRLCKDRKTAPLFPDKFALVKKILHILSHVIGIGFAIGSYNCKHYGTYFKADATTLTKASLELKEHMEAVSKVMRPSPVNKT